MKDICEAIIAGYAAGKSGLDDDMIQHLIDLGDRAEYIMQAIERIEALENALAGALNCWDLSDQPDHVDYPTYAHAVAVLGRP